MLAKRIIPCLDIKDGQTVKGINFLGLKDVGDPVELGRRYAEQGADELVYLDISATQEGRRTFAELVTRIAERINIPFTVGGGIASVEDAGRLLAAGADKVTVNSAAVRNPELISDIASKYGSQFVVVAIDAKQADGRWRVTTAGSPTGSFSPGPPRRNGAERARFCSRRWTTTGRKTATRATPTPGCRSGCRFPSSPRAEPDRYGTSPMC